MSKPTLRQRFSLPLSLEMCFSLFVIAGCCLIVALAVALICLSVSGLLGLFCNK